MTCFALKVGGGVGVEVGDDAALLVGAEAVVVVDSELAVTEGMLCAVVVGAWEAALLLRGRASAPGQTHSQGQQGRR